MPASVWILNLTVLAVVLEADLGRRKIGWIRVLRPLLTAVAICPLFLDAVPTSRHNLALMAAGVGAGVLLGLAAHLFVSVGYGPVKSRKGPRDRAFSRAGFGYAAFWVVIFGSRLLFIYGASHWFPAALGQFLQAHQLSGNGLTDVLIFMAIAMALARSALLGIRGRAAGRRAADRAVAPPMATSSIR
ncbi:MAG: hypothetical protein JO016_03260 [Actinobacteria bacterium]|nr:hypothetical protein [Actinomycetota bacterium]